MTKSIHPEFDGAWFVYIDDRLIEAKTLSALANKLGPNYSITGYYPQGFLGEIKARKSRDSAVEPTIYSSNKKQLTISVHAPSPPIHKHDIKPPVKLGRPPKTKYVRPSGDLVAVQRSDFEWSDEKIATMKRMQADGAGSTEIGCALGCSRNSVIGKTNRERTRDERRKLAEAIQGSRARSALATN